MKQLTKSQKLILSLFFDALGYASFIIPLAWTDIIWAPLSAFLITKLYQGKKIKSFAFLQFIEEIFLFIDVIPTFTITWVYVYYFSKDKNISATK